MFELVLRSPESLVETISDALVDELDALAVTVEDADAGTESERALFGEPGLPAPAAAWARSTVRALFETEHAAEAAAAVLLAQRWPMGTAGRREAQAEADNEITTDNDPAAPFVQALQPVPDQDWVRLTQSQFAPVPVTSDFWIVPSWHEPPAGARTVIRLDPGLAFGTGTHPTTRMCLRWLAREAPARAKDWSRVLDYGCGSGILAIAAAKLGASNVDAVDIDAAAVQATADNARRNDVALRASLPQTPSAPVATYPLVLANILATPLKLLAPLLAGNVAPGGWLVMAGILERQADDLRAAYAPHLAIEVLDTEDGWILMGCVAGGGPFGSTGASTSARGATR